jgi:hypothetical protein
MNSPAALAPRLASLSAEHRLIDDLIRAEMRRPAPDFAHIAALKRRKLGIKDQISELSRRAAETKDGLTA